MTYRITENCTGCGQCVQWCPTRAIKGRRKVGYNVDYVKCLDCGACGRICTHSAVIDSLGNLSIRLPFSQWKRPKWDMETCVVCDKCINACPVRCIQPAGRDEPESAMILGYPFLTRPKMCLGCGFCEAACQVTAIQMIEKSEWGFK